MKTNRINLFQRCLMVLLLCMTAAGPGCNMQKQLNRQRTELMVTEEQNVQAKSFKQYSFNGSRITWQADSSDHHYQVSIQPTDIFTYSPQRGFSGRASGIEIEGYTRSGRRLNDSSTRAVIAMDTQQISLQHSRLEKQDIRSTLKEKEHKPGMSTLLIVLMVILAIVAAYFVKRYIPFRH